MYKVIKHFSPSAAFERLFPVLLGTLVLWSAGVDEWVASQLLEYGILGAFGAGVFYTSGLTTPFAMLIIADLMKMNDPLAVALAAAFGAAIMDFVLFKLLKKELEMRVKKMMRYIQKKLAWLNGAAPVIGFFVFGSPLPDELGLALMEFTNVDALKLAVIVFFAKLITLMLIFKYI